MFPDYIFPIPSVYTKSQEDTSEIQRYQDKNVKDRWKLYTTFKKNIKKHLLNEQKGRCMFCRRVIEVSQAPAELEHLLPKSKYPQFETLPKNLVLTCHCCNNHKSDNNPLVHPHSDPSQQTYPNQSVEFRTVYPYLDQYEQHIDIDNTTGVAVKLSQKGEVTISWYNLNRPELIIRRHDELNRETFPLTRQLMIRLCEADGETQKSILSQIQKIINDNTTH